uniref:Required for meiotic nuclear division protein 1 homolog (inferred by orthology to a human protein) n=1 Tax=Strongyloides venezuelensis TaxID=75913 RepID=A0A0K0G2C9_STRVS
MGRFIERRSITKSINYKSAKLHQVYTQNDLNNSIPDITKRVLRKKRYSISGQMKEKPSISPTIYSYAIGETIDLHALQETPIFRTKYDVAYVDSHFPDVLHFSQKRDIPDPLIPIKEFYIFTDGVGVFWNVSEKEIENLLTQIKIYTENPYDHMVTEDEKETMKFLFSDNKTTTEISQNDEVVFNKNISQDPTSINAILERYAFSQAMAASVKIGIWENRLAGFAEPLQKSSQALRKGKVIWRRDETIKMSGEFAVLRHSLNLKTSLLDTDFYWDRDELHNYYNRMAKYFSLDYRIRLLNSRLTYCEDLAKLIDNLQQHRHASNLEWMIIILIVVEVIFDIFHFVKPQPVTVNIVNESDAKIKSIHE